MSAQEDALEYERDRQRARRDVLDYLQNMIDDVVPVNGFKTRHATELQLIMYRLMDQV